jgi:hypothetical protein
MLRSSAVSTTLKPYIAKKVRLRKEHPKERTLGRRECDKQAAARAGHIQSEGRL